jgi:hypothetical protein
VHSRLARAGGDLLGRLPPLGRQILRGVEARPGRVGDDGGPRRRDVARRIDDGLDRVADRVLDLVEGEPDERANLSEHGRSPGGPRTRAPAALPLDGAIEGREFPSVHGRYGR